MIPSYEEHLSNAPVWIHTHRFDNRQLHCPRCKCWIAFLIKPKSYVSDTRCLMQCYAEASSATASIEHRNILLACCCFIRRSDVQHTRNQYKSSFWNCDLFRWIAFVHVENTLCVYQQIRMQSYVVRIHAEVF